MTKRDWTALFIRLLGLYLIATHIATFAVTTASLVLASTQKTEAARAASQYLWTGPFASAMVLLIGVVLVARAGGITSLLLKNEK